MARDEAFCFYYEDNLDLLKSLGTKLIFFSPLHDDTLPKDLDGILFGGGYPELYLKELEENESMRNSVKSAIENGAVAVMTTPDVDKKLLREIADKVTIIVVPDTRLGLALASCNFYGNLKTLERRMGL